MTIIPYRINIPISILILYGIYLDVQHKQLIAMEKEQNNAKDGEKNSQNEKGHNRSNS
ncbi:hypothetical protein OAS1_29360 [Bacillus sp. YKCMOAS1]|nr:hypothetical protein OAS1_29360 [Bacillus sp. YKCMOAS1]